MLLPRSDYRLIDLLKIIAAHCVVLHHFAFYGPLSEALAQAAPGLSEWFFTYGRMAVQVFLVVAGYLAARSLGASTMDAGRLLRSLWQRYERLALPFFAALLICVACAAWARPHLEGDLVPAVPRLGQWLAHVFLLHSVLKADSLSAGVWYVAIDFQLYALLAILLWLANGNHWIASSLVAAMAITSLTWFNLDPSYDVWAVYFFGSYGLGVLARWSGLRTRHCGYALVLYLLTLIAGLGSLALAFRERIALAMGISTVLASFGSAPMQLPRMLDHWIRRLSNYSYALFLVHFSVLLLANAVWTMLPVRSSTWSVPFTVIAWATCSLASYLFHTQIELRIAQWRSSKAGLAVQAAK